VLERAREEAKRFFDGLWAEGDYWALETAPYDQARFARYLQLLSGRRYERGLEIGAGALAFTRLLAPRVDHLLALEVSERAIERGRAAGVPANVEYRTGNVIDLDFEGEGTWDLVVFAETIYYLGWLLPVFDVFWLASEIQRSLRGRGRLLLANTFLGDDIMDERLIRTYRDLVRNTGLHVEHEEVLTGEKDETAVRSLITLLVKEQATS
jgi:SAM-dependent methyltransferase